MKITLCVPKGKNVKERLVQELSVSKNIKNKEDSKSIAQGLTKIIGQLEDGKAYLWDGQDLDVFDYPLNDFVYYCHKSKFKKPDLDVGNTYLLVTISLDEAVIAELKGTKITILWKDTSLVPKKHRNGGQSAPRFARARELAIKHWYKEVAKALQTIYYERYTTSKPKY